MACKTVALLPVGAIPYKLQVAGHKESATSTSARTKTAILNRIETPMLLRHPSYPIIYKWLQDNARGLREVAFYEMVYDEEANEAMQRLRPFIPRFYGVFRCPQSRNLYLGMSDNLAAFKRPNVCDVKLGTIGYRPDTAEAKKAREDAKYSWRADLGFLLCGMLIYDTVKETHVEISKQFCRSLSPEEVYNKALLPFLGSDPVRRIVLARSYLARLMEMLTWFEQYGAYAMTFCRTSLLMGHDAIGDSMEVVTCFIDFTDWAVKPIAESHSFEVGPCELTRGFSHGLSVLVTLMQCAAEEEPANENSTDSE